MGGDDSAISLSNIPPYLEEKLGSSAGVEVLVVGTLVDLAN